MVNTKYDALIVFHRMCEILILKILISKYQIFFLLLLFYFFAFNVLHPSTATYMSTATLLRKNTSYSNAS